MEKDDERKQVDGEERRPVCEIIIGTFPPMFCIIHPGTGTGTSFPYRRVLGLSLPSPKMHHYLPWMRFDFPQLLHYSPSLRARLYIVEAICGFSFITTPHFVRYLSPCCCEKRWLNAIIEGATGPTPELLIPVGRLAQDFVHEVSPLAHLSNLVSSLPAIILIKTLLSRLY